MMRCLSVSLAYAEEDRDDSTCSIDDDQGLRIRWAESGTLLVQESPANTTLILSWHAYDGLRHLDFGHTELQGEEPDVLTLLSTAVRDLDIDLNGPVLLRPKVQAFNVDNIEVGLTLAPAIRVDFSGAEARVLAPEVVEIHPELIHLLPEGAGGRFTRVAVSSDSNIPPTPAAPLDNSDKLFDATGEPAAFLNADLLDGPDEPIEELTARLRLLGMADRLDDVLRARAISSARKQAAVQALTMGAVSP